MRTVIRLQIHFVLFTQSRSLVVFRVEVRQGVFPSQMTTAISTGIMPLLLLLLLQMNRVCFDLH